MDTLFQTYIELIYKTLSLSKPPAVLENEKARLIADTEKYKNKISAAFGNKLEYYPALQQEFFANFSDLKVGAFFEYQLDTFVPELQEVTKLRSEVEQAITELQQNYEAETCDWLPYFDQQITAAYQYLTSSNSQTLIAFLNYNLKQLREKREIYDAAKIVPVIAPQTNSKEADKLLQEQKAAENRLKAQQLFKERQKNKK